MPVRSCVTSRAGFVSRYQRRKVPANLESDCFTHVLCFLLVRRTRCGSMVQWLCSAAVPNSPITEVERKEKIA